jgi:hypothetical protein
MNAAEHDIGTTDAIAATNDTTSMDTGAETSTNATEYGVVPIAAPMVGEEDLEGFELDEKLMDVLAICKQERNVIIPENMSEHSATFIAALESALNHMSVSDAHDLYFGIVTTPGAKTDLRLDYVRLFADKCALVPTIMQGATIAEDKFMNILCDWLEPNFFVKYNVAIFINYALKSGAKGKKYWARIYVELLKCNHHVLGNGYEYLSDLTFEQMVEINKYVPAEYKVAVNNELFARFELKGDKFSDLMTLSNKINGVTYYDSLMRKMIEEEMKIAVTASFGKYTIDKDGITDIKSRAE